MPWDPTFRVHRQRSARRTPGSLDIARDGLKDREGVGLAFPTRCISFHVKINEVNVAWRFLDLDHHELISGSFEQRFTLELLFYYRSGLFVYSVQT